MRLPPSRLNRKRADTEESIWIIRHGIELGINYIDWAWPYHLGDGVRSYGYNAANRLVAVVSGTLTTTQAYHGDGHRLSEVQDGVTTTFAVAVLGLSQVLVG